MGLVQGPKCPECNIEKHPWGLREWKCPQCGAIGGNTLDDLAKRVEALEQIVAPMMQKSEGPKGQVA